MSVASITVGGGGSAAGDEAQITPEQAEQPADGADRDECLFSVFLFGGSPYPRDGVVHSRLIARAGDSTRACEDKDTERRGV